MAEEVMSESVTGGKKGVKLARFDLIPTRALYALAEHYGKGCQKYGDRNWEKGIEWGKGYTALQRHATAFWNGEDLDEEGNSHLIAVAFWALALFTYSTDAGFCELDDRTLDPRKESSYKLA
jgi:hypothetical protein